MKAVRWHRYGGPEVLGLQEAPQPSPRPDEVLVKIHASTVTTGDCRLRALRVPAGFGPFMRLAFGWFKPRRSIPGMDFSGEVVAIGDKVSQFEEGDEVYGTMGMRLGANAEYSCLAEGAAMVRKPQGLTHEESAAMVFGGLTAIYFLTRRVSLDRGQKLLIIGASGAVGSASVQLAKQFGAHVTGVCSTANVEWVRSLGADEVIDYTRDDFAKSPERYDVILDAAGKLPTGRLKTLLGPEGKLILLTADLLTNLRSVFDKHLVCGAANECKENLEFLREQLEQGIIKPVIDRVYPLESTADAHAYVDQGHKRGNVVIRIVSDHS